MDTKAQQLIIPAEFERNEGILMSWDCTSPIDSVMADIASAASASGRLWILYSTDNGSCDSVQILSFLQNYAIDESNLRFIPVDISSHRTRDFGPVVGYSYSASYERFFYDAICDSAHTVTEDSLPQLLGSIMGIPVNDLSLRLEGTNLQFDGLSRGFATERILSQNPQYSRDQLTEQLKNYFRLEDFTFLPELHHSGGGPIQSVDSYVKVVDPETILVTSYPDSLPDAPVTDAVAEMLSQMNNGFGRTYRVYRIPAAPKENGKFPLTEEEVMHTYTTSLILNGKALIPSYNSYFDSVAKEIYESVLPGYEIVQIRANLLAASFESIPAATTQIAQEGLFRFRHFRINGAQEYQPEMYISCYPQTNGEVDSITVHYKFSSDTAFSVASLMPACPGYIAVIPDLHMGDTVSYYLSALPSANTITEPLTAPAGTCRFWFIDPHTGITEQLNYPKAEYLFPNPTHGVIWLGGEQAAEKQIIFELYDSQGRKVFEKSPGMHENCLLLPARLKNGVYLARILKGQEHINSTLILQR